MPFCDQNCWRCAWSVLCGMQGGDLVLSFVRRSDAPYNWLADFNMTESDLQIASYPSLYPMIDMKGNLSIDPFSSAPTVGADPFAAQNNQAQLPSFAQLPTPHQAPTAAQATTNAKHHNAPVWALVMAHLGGGCC